MRPNAFNFCESPVLLGGKHLRQPKKGLNVTAVNINGGRIRLVLTRFLPAALLMCEEMCRMAILYTFGYSAFYVRQDTVTKLKSWTSVLLRPLQKY